MQRRDLLKGFLFAAAAHSLYARRGFALGGQFNSVNGVNGARQKRFFVLIRAAGGMDVTLGLDPRIHSGGSDQNDMFIEYRADEILASGALRLAPAAAVLLPYAGDMAVVNGVFMSDSNIGHDANLDYASTGDSEGRAADMPIEIAAANGAGPFGVVFNSSLKRGNRVIMPTTTDNLLGLRQSIEMSQLESYIRSLPGTDDFHRSQIALLENANARHELVKALDSLKSDLESQTSDTGATSVGEARKAAATIAAAFSSGAARQGLIDIRSSLDTHSAHEKTHLTNQQGVWEAVAHAFRIFKSVPFGAQGASLFDMTTFAVVSEFARTPALNASAGKDHNPLTNSVLLAGGGVRGGQSVGASRLVLRRESRTGEPRHCAGPINYRTGAAARTREEARSDDFQFIYPENILATVANITGVDRTNFATISSTLPALDLVVR